jgi:hypothetical protein
MLVLLLQLPENRIELTTSNSSCYSVFWCHETCVKSRGNALHFIFSQTLSGSGLLWPSGSVYLAVD